MLKLGGLTLQSKYLLAPLEGVSCYGFRELCGALGAGLTYTEMCRASSIASKNKATLDLIDSHSSVTPTGLQILVNQMLDFYPILPLTCLLH